MQTTRSTRFCPMRTRPLPFAKEMFTSLRGSHFVCECSTIHHPRVRWTRHSPRAFFRCDILLRAGVNVFHMASKCSRRKRSYDVATFRSCIKYSLASQRRKCVMEYGPSHSNIFCKKGSNSRTTTEIESTKVTFVLRL